MNNTPAPAITVTDDMRRRHYAALSNAASAYTARQAPAREHNGMSDAVRRTFIAATAHARMALRNR